MEETALEETFPYETVLNMQRFKLKEVQVRKIVSQKRRCKKSALPTVRCSAEEYYLSLFTVIKVHSKHLNVCKNYAFKCFQETLQLALNLCTVFNKLQTVTLVELAG